MGAMRGNVNDARKWGTQTLASAKDAAVPWALRRRAPMAHSR
jgi:hypothetical protein